MEPMVEEGLRTFKVFLAYKGVLMVTDDLFFRVLEHDARPRRADDGALRERLGDRRAGRARAGRRPDRPDPPRLHAARVRGGGGHRPRRALRRARGRGRLHRARHVRAGSRRDRGRPGARRERLRRDVPAVPDQHGRRPEATRTSRALATCARHRCGRRGTSRCCGRRSITACSRASRPTTARSTASRRRWGATTSRRSPTAWR